MAEVSVRSHQGPTQLMIDNDSRRLIIRSFWLVLYKNQKKMSPPYVTVTLCSTVDGIISCQLMGYQLFYKATGPAWYILLLLELSQDRKDQEVLVSHPKDW